MPETSVLRVHELWPFQYGTFTWSIQLSSMCEALTLQGPQHNNLLMTIWILTGHNENILSVILWRNSALPVARSKTKKVIWLHFNYEILMDFVFFVQEEYINCWSCIATFHLQSSGMSMKCNVNITAEFLNAAPTRPERCPIIKYSRLSNSTITDLTSYG
jgi:hypothetical protein